MGKLIYSMATSLDGFVSDPSGEFGWGSSGRGGARVRQRAISIDRHGPVWPADVRDDGLLGDGAHAPEQPAFILEYARLWQATDKIVYSTTLNEVASARTRIERTFDPAAVRKLKVDSDLDIAVAGPHLAAQAIDAGLVDEYQLFVGPAIVGGGNPFFPDDIRLDLELRDERRFGNGVVYLATA